MLDGTVAAAHHAQADLVCFSHLRWDFVFQRVQHLLGRAATRHYRVTFWEEPIHTRRKSTHRLVSRVSLGRRVGRAALCAMGRRPGGCTARDAGRVDRGSRGIVDPVLWYYTPMALAFSGHLSGRPVVYDCMDELGAFAGADDVVAASGSGR